MPKKAYELSLRPNLIEQGMENLEVKRKYRTIIVPSLSFQLVVNDNLAHEAIRRFYNHLEIEGALVIPFVIFWENGDPEELPWKMLYEQKNPSDNRIFRKWSYAKFDGKKQLQHTEDRYEILLNGEVVKSEHHRRSPALRWYTQKQATQLNQFAGFKSVQILHGFGDQPALEHDTFFTIVGIK